MKIADKHLLVGIFDGVKHHQSKGEVAPRGGFKCSFPAFPLSHKRTQILLKGPDPMKKNTVIAVANQKGGAGKTTSALNVGVCLQEKGYKVLLIDLDPQNSLTTTYLQHDYDPEQPTISELMNATIERKTIDAGKCICHNDVNNIDYIPTDIRLATVEKQLVVTRYSETVLQRALKKSNYDYDYIIIDCPPSLSTLLYNALCAAQYVLVPVLAQKLALDGVPMLLDTVDEVKENVNPALEVVGYIVSVYENNTKMSRDVVDTLKENFGDDYLGYISKSSAAATSSVDGKAFSTYKVRSRHQYFNRLGGEYAAIVDKIIARTK